MAALAARDAGQARMLIGLLLKPDRCMVFIRAALGRSEYQEASVNQLTVSPLRRSRNYESGQTGVLLYYTPDGHYRLAKEIEVSVRREPPVDLRPWKLLGLACCGISALLVLSLIGWAISVIVR